MTQFIKTPTEIKMDAIQGNVYQMKLIRFYRWKRLERAMITAFNRVGRRRLDGSAVDLVQAKLWQIGLELNRLGGGVG